MVVPSPATSEVFDATSRTIWAPMFSSGILELDFFGYGDAVFGDGGRTEFLFDDDVAAFGAERHFDGIRQNIHAAQNRLAGIFSMQNLLCHFADLLMLMRSRSSV